MYANIGKKIKALAKIIGWLMFILFLLLAISTVTNSSSIDDFFGLVFLICGVVALVMSWPLYGFGQLIDDMHALRTRFAPEQTVVTPQPAQAPRHTPPVLVSQQAPQTQVPRQAPPVPVPQDTETK